MIISKIPKFVINLERRKDRLENVLLELEHIGWQANVFSAIDTRDYIGCGLSHKAIAKIALENNYDYIIVIEDDIFFMPYAKKLLGDLDNILFNQSIDWKFFHFAPSIHRPLMAFNDWLIDLTDVPPKNENIHRGIFGTTGYIASKEACEYIIEWDTNKYLDNINKQIAIDQYFDSIIYPNIKSLAPKWPIMVQKPDQSDINKTYDQNHYLMTYNWNLYCPYKISESMFNHEYCKKLRNEN